MTVHPSADELLSLVRGRLAPKRGGEILRHLHAGCEICLAAAPAGLVAGLGVQRDLTSEEVSATEDAIDRAFAVAVREDRELCRQRTLRAKAVKILVEGGVKGPEKLPRSMKQVDKIEALLAASWSLRHEDIGMMIFFVRLAVECAEQLDPRKYGCKEVFDFQCRAQAELGNAYRASDQFDKAETALTLSRQLYELGTRSDFLEIRLLDLEASLDADCRRFGDACIRLRKVLRYFRRNGNHHLAGRTLLQLGRFTGYAGEAEGALRLINESLSLLDFDQDPGLVYTAMHNQTDFLLSCGRCKEAEIQLFHLRALRKYVGGRINDLRFHWLSGRVDAGLNRSDRAEQVFREIQQGFLEVNRAYDSALASLDLAAVLLAQKKAREATEVVTAAYRIFSGLRIEREGWVAVLMLLTACEVQMATRELAERIARFLRRLENDPHAKLED